VLKMFSTLATDCAALQQVASVAINLFYVSTAEAGVRLDRSLAELEVQSTID